MKQVGSVLWPKHRVLQIYGANTGVGKTIFSSILCRAFQKRLQNVFYLKPVSTGPLDEADDHHINSFGSGIKSACLFQFDDPVSPHLAVRSAGRPIPDQTVLKAVHDELRKYASTAEGISIVETAGGVLSPSPSGSSQADLYRPLRLPTLLVGDHQLGGIGTTISAWESLHIRGYDVQSVALFAEDRYDNHSYLKEYFAERNVNTFSIRPPPERHASAQADAIAMKEYYQQSSESAKVLAFTDDFIDNHDRRIDQLRKMPEEAVEAIWHPFLQHTERSKDTVTAWDSAYGDFLQSYTTKATSYPETQSVLTPAFDGSASWWTQGLGHGNPKLALTAAHAAGRYGHVMFGGSIHEPALKLAQTLLQKSDNPRLSKVFYTDNGSTGIEVAVKMALRAARLRAEWSDSTVTDTNTPLNLQILGLKNSYHGDTIGTMDCSEPSIYNEKVEWYQGRGVWLDFPTVKMRNGVWHVEPFLDTDSTPVPARPQTFDSLAAIFDFSAREADATAYRTSILRTLHALPTSVRLGALLIEPILLGAGGMLFADPLYQRVLVEVARNLHTPTPTTPSLHQSSLDWRGMPVIFDEVFTGLYRLGRFSAASFLGVHPDIVVNAKLLTGGLVPLCTTAASDAIFQAFLSPDKTDALLHGHSYTAHPVGCAVANASLAALADVAAGPDWAACRADWSASSTSTTDTSSSSAAAKVDDGHWSMWTRDFLAAVSRLEGRVDGVFALGAVLAVTLRDGAGGGYASTAATGVRDKLLAGPAKDVVGAGEGNGSAVIHSRVLGNVLYLMAAMTTSRETIAEIQERLLEVLQE